MDDNILANKPEIEEEDNRNENTLLKIGDQLLFDARTDLATKKTISMPIAQLSTLGTGVSSLLPELRTVTETTTMNMKGLYQLSNEAIGDTLKQTRAGDYWGAFKTAEGKSKFARLKEADTLTVTTQRAAQFNPATMMMAVALFSIEEKLNDIEKIQ